MPRITPLFHLSLLALAVSPVFAGDALELPEVTVTAKGYQASKLETAGASVVLEPTQRLPGDNVGALMRGQPGLAVQSDGAWGQNPVLRGQRLESIVLQVDGNRLNSAQPQGAIASLADLGLLERVEVIKGPSSVLHGSGALGGVVNMLTPEPTFDHAGELNGRVGLGLSSVDEGLQGAALLETGNQRHGLVLGGAAKRVHDYEGADGEVDNTGYESRSMLFKYAYSLGEYGHLHLNLQQHKDEDVWFPGSTKPAPAAVLGNLTIHSPNTERTLYAAGYEGEVGSGTLSVDLYQQEVYREIRAYSSGLDRNQVWNDVTFTTRGVRSTYRLPLGEAHLLSVGVDQWRMTGDPARYQFAGPSQNIQRNDPFSDGQIDSAGVFIQDDMQFGRLNVQAGARWDRVKGDADSKGSGASRTTKGLSNSDSNLSWSLGAIYNLQPLLNPYLSFGRAYRAPDMRERFEDATRGDGYFHQGNPQLKPEQATSLELGLKGNDGRSSYQLAAYYSRIDDYIAGRVTGQTNAQGLPIKRTENLDKVIIQGTEGQFAHPVGVVTLDGSFTWLEGDNRQDDEPLYRMPPPELTLGIGQPRALGFSWHSQVRAVKNQDRVATRFSNGTENDTAGFVTVDASLGWGFSAIAGMQNLDLGLTLRNLLDKGYHEHLTEGISGWEIQSPGRNVALTLRGEF
ncbi:MULTISPECIES: TonB-dependent receptor [Pseudomonas]|jgi:hemoglobin/transferrin/lactoferrin receptor protein|uniref:TonB-dependent receptor n=1 Tax=Pseudomonas abyssi TaxID=170540 RepID=A0A2A3MG43_9PSED|nr:TonB-dependent receptor [Pseudomonas abyssi]MAD01823.1 TonB-dependent receptor [Pseudomonadales bacterium]PBK03796.1 TonB-dependent receptor [Pseudomonas abyssi]|tara:strand:- start:43456 stop:45501 length:2046 start_codon:yes stop_codon:yes gene_type:complete